MTTLLKSSKYHTSCTNTGKQEIISEFLDDYSAAVWWYVDYLWDNKITWGNNNVLDIKNNKFDIPDFLPSTATIKPATPLSGRAIKSASKQALMLVSSRVAERGHQFYVLKQKMKEGHVAAVKNLQSKIDGNPLTKPTKKSKHCFADLDSNCCEFIPQQTVEFAGFLKLKSIGKKYGHIYIPFNYTNHSNNLDKQGFTMKTSWQIGKKQICSRWEKDIPKSTGSKVIGGDQGLTTCFALSDTQVTGECIHSHDLRSIVEHMDQLEKGSKAFRRAQAHRENYINWSIKQLNLDDVKTLRKDDLTNMYLGKTRPPNLKYWPYAQINAAVLRRCKLLGVQVIDQPSQYRSQRCSDCGWVHKSNRKGKEFICKTCGVVHDADVNGALNHEADLYQLPYGLWRSKINRTGFFWTSSGIYDASGQEFTVPDVPK